MTCVGAHGRADESTRTAIGAVIAERVDSLRTTAYPLRTETASPRHRHRSDALASLDVVVQRVLLPASLNALAVLIIR